MKVYLANDHTGLALKTKLKEILEQKGYAVEDCGSYSYDKDDDYPDWISKAAEKVSHEPQTSRGVIIGGSGQGEAMVANKYPGVRCALFYTPALPTQAVNIEGQKSTDPYAMIALTREHNGANMLSLGARFMTEETAIAAVTMWLTAADPTEERHKRRIKKIGDIEKTIKSL